MTSRSVWRIALYFVACVGLGTRQGSGDEPADVEQIRALAASYLANIESFAQIECEYDVMQFRPASEDELYDGRLKPEASARGIWIRAGSTVRCELNVDDETLADAVKKERIVFIPRRDLIEGMSGIAFNRLLNGGVLYSRDYPPEQLPRNPFDFGGFSGSAQLFTPGLALTDRNEWKPEMESVAGPPPNEPNASKSGAQLVGVKYSVRASPDNVLELRFWLDPSRGTLPIIAIAYMDGKLKQKAVVTDVRSVADNRGFPMRSIRMQYGGGDEPKIAFAVETRVRKLAVGAPIDPALLRIEVEKNARLRDAADDSSQFRFEEGGSVGMADIPALMERAAAQSKQEAEWKKINAEHAALAQAGTTEPEKRSLLLYVNAGLLLLLAFALVIVLIRKRRRTAPDAG